MLTYRHGLTNLQYKVMSMIIIVVEYCLLTYYLVILLVMIVTCILKAVDIVAVEVVVVY